MLGALTEKRLQELKRKFLLPFASQRQVNGKLVVVPWMPRPPVGLKVPEGHLRQARVPVKASVEDIKKASTRLVKGQLPLELLTRQPNPVLLASVRAQMQSTDMERRLQPGKMQALVISIQEAWAAAILTFLETPAGVAFAIPALLVTAKMLIEVIFRAQYEDVLRAENNSLQLIEEINMMCMSLLDTDCTFAHFAALDALSEGTKLWRKLQALLQRKQGAVARTEARTCRTSALLRRALVGQHAAPADSRTRRFLAKSASDTESGPPRSAPHQDPARAKRHEKWQDAALLRAQMQASKTRPNSAEDVAAAVAAPARRSSSAQPRARQKG